MNKGINITWIIYYFSIMCIYFLEQYECVYRLSILIYESSHCNENYIAFILYSLLYFWVTTCSKYKMMRFSKCSKYESPFKFTWERVFCEKYIWFEKVASWHDVRLHKDHSLKTLCSIISQSLRYASECMRIDVAQKFWRFEFRRRRMFIILQVSKVFDEFKR